MKISELLDSTPKWQNPDPRIRLEAVNAGKLEQSTLIEIARNDEDADVRVAAIGRLQDESTLQSLANDSEACVIRSAIERQAELIISDTGENRPRIDSIKDPRILTKIAVEAPDIELRLDSVRHLDTEEHLEEVLQAPNSSRVYQLCAERIDKVERLERIHKDFLGKDKSVAKIARNKLTEIREREAASRAFVEECESVCAVLEKMSNEHPTDDFERKLSFHRDRWKTLADREPLDEDIRRTFEQLSDRFEAASLACQQTLDNLSAREQELSQRASETVRELEEFLGALNQEPEKLEQLEIFLGSIEHKWPVGFSEDHELTEKFYRHTARLESIKLEFQKWCRIRDDLNQLVGNDDAEPGKIRKLMKNIQWPADIPEPALLQQARNALDSLAREKEEEARERQSKIEKIEEQIGQFENHIKEGRTRPATKLQTAITRGMESVKTPKKLQDHFKELSIQLRELRDWQGFATTPKREELCSKMEALRDDTGIHPGEKAKAIKELQDEWKKLGPSDSRENQRLWSRFKAAGDAAFEPCAKYFGEQAQRREQNLKERERICDSLELFLEQNDWNNPDWKGVSHIIYQAKGEWGRFRDVPNAERKKIQKRFAHVMDRLEKKLEGEQKQNEATKRELIEQVKQLLEEDPPTQELISRTKQIQQDWKDVGLTRRAIDQKLWKEFRSQCDLVFARRDKEHAAKKGAVAEKQGEARAIVDKLKSHIESDESIDKARLNQLRGEFKQVSLDRDGAHIGKEFNRLLKEGERIIQEQARAGEQQMMGELKRKAAICAAIEAGETTADDAEKQWHSDITLTPELAERIDQRRSLALSGTCEADTLTEYQKSAELICIQMEILAELESPPEASATRMQYQVDRLNREFSQGQHDTRSPREQLRDLQTAWYCLGPIAENAARLRQRFQTAEAILEGNRRD